MAAVLLARGGRLAQHENKWLNSFRGGMKKLISFLKRKMGLCLIAIGGTSAISCMAYDKFIVWPIYRVQTIQSYRQSSDMDSNVLLIGGLSLIIVFAGLIIFLIQFALRIMRRFTTK